MKIQSVKCKSGLVSWRSRLHDIYTNFEEFDSYSEIYGIAARLGYKTSKGAWKSNPIIEGSCNPSNLRKVK